VQPNATGDQAKEPEYSTRRLSIDIPLGSAIAAAGTRAGLPAGRTLQDFAAAFAVPSNLAADGARATPEPGSGKPLSVIGLLVLAVAACVLGLSPCRLHSLQLFAPLSAAGLPAYAAEMVTCFLMPGALPFPEPVPLEEPETYSATASRNQSIFCGVASVCRNGIAMPAS
jgi:hypothetical protein